MHGFVNFFKKIRFLNISVFLYIQMVLIAAVDSCCSNANCHQTESSRQPNAKGFR